MEFCISILLLRRKAGLIEYTDAVVQRPEVQAMIPRVNFYVDPEAETGRLRQDDQHHQDSPEGRPRDFRQCAIREGQSGESDVVRRSGR